ncbi:MAG: hypothetical protein ACI84D_002614, partial [Thalassolituus oleivorans]
MKGRTRNALFAGLLVAGGLAAWFLPLDAWILDLVDSIRNTGVVGVALFAAIYIGAPLT